MPKGLFIGLPLHGHTNPSLPLVRELVARGHEIAYASSPPFEAKVVATGARYLSYRNTFVGKLTELPQKMEELSWLLTQTTAQVLDHDLDAFRAEHPDYVIADSVAPWGAWIGEALRVPVITSITTFAFNRHVLAYAGKRGVRPKSARVFISKLRFLSKALRLVRQLRRKHQINGPGLVEFLFPQSPLNIVYTSRHFQPCAETFDDRYHFTGPSIDVRVEATPFPWTAIAHPVVVYVSMGTLFNRDESFYRVCFDAFRDVDAQIVLSIGSNVPIRSLGDPPPNFVVRPHVPQLEVLQRASAFVTHAGMNSVSESLYYGVPIVALPQMGEQHIVARRVEELGAGRLLQNHEATPQMLRAAVSTILEDGRYRAQARLVGESLRTAGGPARGADAIHEFVRASAQLRP